MGLTFPDLFGAYHPRAEAAVRRGTAFALGQSVALLRSRRYDELTPHAHGNPMRAAELSHLRGPADTEPCLQRTRFVIDAGVDDAAVAPALVLCDVRFLFQDGDSRVRVV